MTNNFEKDINVPSKEIIIKFSDGYCIVLENNEVSIRENAFTKFRIVFGKRTNELLEFVKELYLDKKVKEQECEKLKEENYQLQKSCQIYKSFIDEIPCKSLRDIDYDLQKVINQRDKYKQALEKIEKFINNQLDNFGNDVYSMDKYGINNIQDIINKVKEK